MDSVGRRVAVAYDAYAAKYATIHAAMPFGLLDLAERFLARLGSEARVLDLGCGAGRDMAWMEARRARVTGVDLSAGMLAQARDIVRGPLAQMDMCHLALTTGSFDGGWCCASLLHVPKAQAPEALAEIRRVLVPEGTLYLGVQEGEGEVWERTPDGIVERFFARYAMDEALELLSQAGFMVIDRSREDAGTRRWLSFIATAPVAADKRTHEGAR